MIKKKRIHTKKCAQIIFYINPLNRNSMTKEELTPEQRDTWTKVLKFAVDVLKLIISAFLGGSASTLIS